MTVLKKFLAAEDGAVTVDWVVLTAGIVGLAIAVMVAVGGPTVDHAEDTGAFVVSVSIATYN